MKSQHGSLHALAHIMANIMQRYLQTAWGSIFIDRRHPSGSAHLPARTPLQYEQLPGGLALVAADLILQVNSVMTAG